MTAEKYLLTGPNGVGKSTIIESLVLLEPGKFQHVKGSAILKEFVGVSSYEELEALDPEYKNRASEEAISALFDFVDTQNNPPTLLVDSHMLFFDKGAVSSTTTEWTQRMTGIAAITADPKQVFERIKQDSLSNKRERSILPENITDEALAVALLAGYIQTSRTYAHEYGAAHLIPTFDIENSSNILNAAGQFIQKISQFRG